MLSGVINFVKSTMGWNNTPVSNPDVDEMAQSFANLSLDEKDTVIPMPGSPSESSTSSSSDDSDSDIEWGRSPQIRIDEENSSDSESSEQYIDDSNEILSIQLFVLTNFNGLIISKDEARLFLRAQQRKQLTDIVSLLKLANEKDNLPFFVYLSLVFKEVLESLPEDCEEDVDFAHGPAPTFSSRQNMLYQAAELGNLNFFIQVENEVGLENNTEFNEALNRAKQEGNIAICEYLQKKYPSGINGETPARVITPGFSVYVFDCREDNAAPSNEVPTSTSSAQFPRRPSQ